MASVTFLLLLLVALAGGGSSPAGAEAVRFKDWFLDKALRIDIHHVGSSDFERACIDELKEEKYFSGPKARLTQGLEMGGSYLFTLHDKASGALIYGNGYSGLFNEWRTIAEARAGVWRAIEHTLIVPWPRKAVILTISKRNHDGTFVEILKQDIPMEKRFIAGDNPYPDLKSKPIMVNGEPGDKVDLLIVGDGYTRKEMSKFDRDAKKTFQAIFEIEPFKTRRRDFNVWSIQSPSHDSSVDQPRKPSKVAWKTTALGVSFNTFDLPRYALTTRIHTLYDIASHAPHDVIVLVFNDPRSGGGGIQNLYAVCSADSTVSIQVLIHELGHALTGLADEYYTSSVSYIDYYPEGVEPPDPNITALLDPRNIKWKHLIQKGTPIPTPKSPKYREVVGCFEGAGYKAKGLYRPCLDCVMFSLRTSDFCPVCLEAVERSIDYYAR